MVSCPLSVVRCLLQFMGATAGSSSSAEVGTRSLLTIPVNFTPITKGPLLGKPAVAPRVSQRTTDHGQWTALVTLVLLAPFAASCPTTTHAADLPELVMVGGQHHAADLVAIHGDSATFQTSDGEQKLPLEQVVRWGALSPRATRPAVVLNDGSLLVTAPVWSRAGSARLTGNQWRLMNVAFRSVQLDRDRVKSVWLGAVGQDDASDQLRRDTVEHEGEEDRVWLVGGDMLSGRLVSHENRNVAFSVAGEPIKIDAGRVAAITLAEPMQAVASALAVGLKDGSLLLANDLKLDGKSAVVTLTSGEVIYSKTPQEICLVQPFGQRVSYLSDRQPLSYRHTPYFDLSWPLARDKGLTGARLQAGARRFLKGLAMHSAARAVYRLDGEWSAFRAQLAIDSSAGDDGAGGSVTYRVYVARDGGFKPAYESPIVRSDQPPLPVSVDVSGAQAIALMVDFADHADRQDHADWLEARLEK